MPWLQVDTELGEAQPEQLEPLLAELGALAVWFRDAGDEPVLEPAPGATPFWSATVISALFPADANRSDISARLTPVLPGLQLRFSEVADRDWLGEWQQSLRPLRFGENIRVIQAAGTGSPADADKSETEIFIRLTPGLAFGTGEHPTTAMCLTWLESQRAELRGQTALDYGCGSGLLAIAALKLGASQATATDLDPQALLATRQNSELNACATRLSCYLPEALPEMQHDVLVANILSNTLIELGPALNALTRPGAPIALSGILSGQADEVCASWSDWAALRVSQRIDDWVLLSGNKHGITGT